jgi:3-mercaptopyruvate sulfurtransferase SseA
MASGPLVSAGQLAAELAGYGRGHLPGAVFVDLDRDLSSPVATGPTP